MNAARHRLLALGEFRFIIASHAYRKALSTKMTCDIAMHEGDITWYDEMPPDDTSTATNDFSLVNIWAMIASYCRKNDFYRLFIRHYLAPSLLSAINWLYTYSLLALSQHAHFNINNQ